MDITPLIPRGRQVITGYGPGSFAISGESYPGSVLVLAEQTLAWDVARVEEVTLESLSPVLFQGEAVELLLLGTGKATARPSPALKQALRERGITLEAMDTGAACRTFNILLSEERRVAAALMAV